MSTASTAAGQAARAHAASAPPPLLKRSRYTHHVPGTDGDLLFNAATGALVEPDAAGLAAYHALVGEEAVTDTASANCIDSAEDFLAGGFVLPAGVDEVAEVHRRYRAWQQDRSTLSLTIAPTLGCNFGCDYCFEGDAHTGGSMTPDVQKALVRWVGRELPGRERLGVVWYGGEPLLCPDVIKHLSGAFRAVCVATGVAYSAGIVTNGYRLDGATAAWLVDLGVVSAQVSLDGPPEEHDRRRHLRGRQGTFARILTNLKQAVDVEGLALVLRVNVDARNVEAAERLVDLLAAEGFAQRPQVQVAFARVVDPAGVGSPLWHQCLAPEEFAHHERRLLAYAHTRGLAPVAVPRPRGGACGAVRASSFVVAPDGALHKCWQTVADPAQAVGSVLSAGDAWCGAEVDDHRWLAWEPAQGACAGCSVLPSCMGGCPKEAMRSGQDDPVCPPLRHTLPDALRAAAAAATVAADWRAGTTVEPATS